ncbi:MAG: hypothetical protein IKG66_09700 [Lachnospiraceae bacterium]|nr:hypothetical protein [Lachnospiraceae bacterium]
MITETYRIAGIPVTITTKHMYRHDRCRAYLTEDAPAVEVVVVPGDIEYEREAARREAEAEGIPCPSYGEEIYEFTAAYRKIAEAYARMGRFLMHGSVVAVDGEAFLFTAKSGTGKSTHTRLWREHFGERAIMVNDDKPLLRVPEAEGRDDRRRTSAASGAADGAGAVMVCGTPWDGKHHLSTNVEVPLSAICLLERGQENRIRRVSLGEALPLLMQQTYRPRGKKALEQVMAMAMQVYSQVPLYRLHCNMDPEAAEVAYEAMRTRRQDD